MPLGGIERAAVRLDFRPSKELLDRFPTVSGLALVVLREESAHRFERLARRERLIHVEKYERRVIPSHARSADPRHDDLRRTQRQTERATERPRLDGRCRAPNGASVGDRTATRSTISSGRGDGPGALWRDERHEWVSAEPSF
jgi:hypothetical protein